jgi:Zn-dependent peptidase ImmA (M78 family)
MAQRLDKDRSADIVALAEEVVSFHSPSAGATNLLKVIEDNAIRLHFDDYGHAFDGALELAGKEFHIHVNTRLSGGRQTVRTRFTLSHELGHFFIDEHRRALVAGEAPHGSTCGLFDSANSPEELEADVFAANLLMPPSRFLPAVPPGATPLAAIKRLSSQFQASITATALHYAKIVADRCAIIRWNPDGTVAWKVIGPSYFNEGFRVPSYSSGTLPLPDSATGLVLSGSQEDVTAASLTSMLFKNVVAGGKRDHILQEEAISLGSYGFMTIISDLKPVSRLT